MEEAIVSTDPSAVNDTVSRIDAFLRIRSEQNKSPSDEAKSKNQAEVQGGEPPPDKPSLPSSEPVGLVECQDKKGRRGTRKSTAGAGKHPNKQLRMVGETAHHDSDASRPSAMPVAASSAAALPANFDNDGDTDVLSSGIDHSVAQPAIADEDLLPSFKMRRNQTEYGPIQTCMCKNPSACRGLTLRWARLGEEKYIHFPRLPTATAKDTPACRHKLEYRAAVLRSLGYPTDSSEPVRRKTQHGEQEATMDKLFSERIAMVHFHPKTFSCLSGKINCDKWRVPNELGEEIGLRDKDRCLTLDSNGDRSFFALPNYSLEEATADVERAEEEYKQAAMEFRTENATICEEMVTNPSKFALKILELEQRVKRLKTENSNLKNKVRGEISEKRALETKGERLERGLEQLARRMDKWEAVQKTGGVACKRDAKCIYKDATGKDLDQEGFFRVEPWGTEKGGRGRKKKQWVDPRMDRAVQAKWANPELTPDEALRAGGFEYPPTDRKGGASEKVTLDSDGISLADRKKSLRTRMKLMRQQLWKRATSDLEAAREYEERYPPVEAPVEGVYAGLDLRSVPPQPFVQSKASNTGFRGVKKTTSGKFHTTIGSGENGQKKCLGTFGTLDEAAGIYARAKYYLKHNGIPDDWNASENGTSANRDHADSDGENTMIVMVRAPGHKEKSEQTLSTTSLE